jgi:6-phosphogluconolactonase
VLRVVVGTFTNASGESLPADFGGRDTVSRGLYTFGFDPRSGDVGQVRLAAEVSNPANLIVGPGVLYACRGQNSRLGGQSPLTAFALDGEVLRELNSVPSGGLGPTVGVVDRAGRHLLTTNWISSSVVSFRLGADGRISERAALIGRASLDGLPAGVGGPPGEAVSAADVTAGHTKPHDVVLADDQRFAIAAEITGNRCRVLRFDADTGALEAHGYADAPPGSGPRHLALRGDRLYTSDEECAALSVWAWEGGGGRLEHLQQVSTVPDGASGTGEHPADVRVHPNGRYVYVTNRRVGTIARFAIDPATGLVSPAGQTPVGSASCWSLVFDPSGRWAFATAILADEVRIYAVEAGTGALRLHQAVSVTLPTCVRLLSPGRTRA